MAVRVVRPEDWEGSDFVEVESDRPENREAISEIEDWAFERGLKRTHEYQLLRISTPEGRPLYRSILYRPDPVESDFRRRKVREIEERAVRLAS